MTFIQSECEDIFKNYRYTAEEKEQELLFHKASLSKHHSRLHEQDNDHRLPYKRDVDRILHSKAYARYVDKTQVVYLVNNDHITHRSLHVQLVSSFARGIAEILHLNLDLVEAIALGHDVGHPPFGHEGEVYLSALSAEYDNGPFSHPFHSCRLFSEIEPLNLGLMVYDGFLCHDGGLLGCILRPRFGKKLQDYLDDLDQKHLFPERDILPSTLEGCLVKLCDTMSYVGRDIEDAIQLGIITRKEVPHTILGSSNREILSVLAKDIIRNSYQQEYIAISEEVYEALHSLRRFNFEFIYTHSKLKVESSKIERSYRLLFEWLLNDLNDNKEKSYLACHFLLKRSEKYRAETHMVQAVIDYMAGMTDHFFVRTFEHLFVPSTIRLD